MSSTTATITPTAPTHHKKLWFESGNLIVIADSMAFKIHRGLLTENSPVIAEMLREEGKGDLYEGCPCLELEDSHHDMVHYLGALYDDLYFSYKRGTDFIALDAVFRLSDKYQSERLRQICSNRLHLDWPNSLSGWDNREQLIAPDYSSGYHPREYFCIPTLVINFANERLAEFSDVLPMAFYDLYRYHPEKVRSFGVDYAKHFPPRYNVSKARTTLPLTPNVRQQYERGREFVTRYIPHFLDEHVVKSKPSDICLRRHHPKPDECSRSFDLLVWYITRSVSGDRSIGGRDGDPLYTLNLVMNVLSMKELKIKEIKEDKYVDEVHKLDFCEGCRKEMVQVCTKAREEIWAVLPKLIGMA